MSIPDTPTPGAGQLPVTDLSFAEASRELDDIVEFFEQRDVDVDQLVGRLERATASVDELDRRICQTRGQVEELVPRLAGVGQGRASEPGDGGLSSARPASEPGEGGPGGDQLAF